MKQISQMCKLSLALVISGSIFFLNASATLIRADQERHKTQETSQKETATSETEKSAGEQAGDQKDKLKRSRGEKSRLRREHLRMLTVSHLTEEGYAWRHGDHEHYNEGLPRDRSKFEEGLLLPAKTKLDKEQLIGERHLFYVVKTEKGPRILLKYERDRLNYQAAPPQVKKKATPAQKNLQLEPGVIGVTDDGFKFKREDIVSETKEGYVVRHGDHFHFVPKDSLQGKDSSSQAGSKPGSHHGSTGSEHKDQGKTPAGNLTQQGFLLGSDALSQSDLERVDFFAAEHGLTRAQLKIQGGYVIWPHKDHFHATPIASLKQPAPGEKPILVDPDEEPEGYQPKPSRPTVKPEPTEAKPEPKPEPKPDTKPEPTEPKETSSDKDETGLVPDPNSSTTLPPPCDDCDDESEFNGTPVDPNPNNEVNEQGLMKGSILLSEDELDRVKYFGERHNIPLSKLQVIEARILIWPHRDHYHADPLDKLEARPKTNHNVTEQGLMKGSDTLSEKDLKRVDVLVKDLGFGREQMLVKDGHVSVFDPKRDRRFEYDLNSIFLNEDFPDTDKTTEQGLKKGSDTLSEGQLAIVKREVDQMGLDLADVYVKGNVLAWERFGGIRTIVLDFSKAE